MLVSEIKEGTSTGIPKKEYDKSPHDNKFEELCGMDKFYEKYKLPKLAQKELEEPFLKTFPQR